MKAMVDEDDKVENFENVTERLLQAKADSKPQKAFFYTLQGNGGQ